MRNPDAFLIGWWVLLIGMTVGSWGYVRAKVHREDREAELAYLQGRSVPTYRQVWTPSTALAGAGLAIGWLLVVLCAGFVLFRMHNWTELHIQNARLWFTLFGVAMLWSAVRFQHHSRFILWLGRTSCAVLGLVVVTFGGLWFGGDLMGDHRIVEGRLERLERGPKNDKYRLIINGREYTTTREVFLRARAGDDVRASTGAISGFVFALDRTD